WNWNSDWNDAGTLGHDCESSDGRSRTSQSELDIGEIASFPLTVGFHKVCDQETRFIFSTSIYQSTVLTIQMRRKDRPSDIVHQLSHNAFGPSLDKTEFASDSVDGCKRLVDHSHIRLQFCK